MQNTKHEKRMNYIKMGFTVSFIIHLLFVALAFYIKKQAAEKNGEVVLEFNVTNIIKTGEYETDTNTMKPDEVVKNEASIPAVVKQETKNRVEEKILEKTNEVIKEEAPVHDKVKRETKNTMDEKMPEKTVEGTKEVKQTVPDTRREPEHVTDPHEREQPGGIPKSDETHQELEQSAENQYIRENFDYINKIIRINISYPYKARKMSMQGDVIISFIVRLDGSVKDIRINKSSGYSTLDDNAEKAVRKASPFPLPPVEVKIVIPITYKLNT